MDDKSGEQSSKMTELWKCFKLKNTFHQCEEFRLQDRYPSFTFTKHRKSSTQQKNTTWGLFPTIFAQEVQKLESEDKAQVDVASLTEKVMKRPQIVVTDEDVQKYLATETGQERLNVMWKKEYVISIFTLP